MSQSGDDMPTTAYKILGAGELAAFERDASFAGSAVDLADGYIHLSTADQLDETVERHFPDRDDLQIVAVDLDSQGAALRWEAARGGALFPHLYGPLLLETVIAYGPLARLPGGRIKLPIAG